MTLANLEGTYLKSWCCLSVRPWTYWIERMIGQDDRMTGCHDNRMTGWQDDKSSGHPVNLSCCHPVILSVISNPELPNDPVTKWPSLSEQVTKWPSDQVTKWPSDWVTKWPSDQMTKWQNDQMTELSNDHMTGWQDNRKLRRRLTVWYIFISNSAAIPS